MTFRFDEPWWLLLALAIIPLGFVGVRWLISMSRARRWSAIVLRTALMLVLGGMLANAAIVRETDRLAVIAVVDVSGSVRQFAGPLLSAGAGSPQEASALLFGRIERFVQEAGTRGDEKAGGRKPDDLAGIVAFDGRAMVVQPAQRTGFVFGALGDLPQTEGSDLEQALRLAAAMIPPDARGRILLISDGVSTAGRTDQALAAIGASRAGETRRRVPVDVVPIRYRVPGEVVLESIDAPPTAPADSTVPIRVVISSTARSSGTLILTQEGEPVDLTPGEQGMGLRLTLEPGQNVERVTVPLGSGRVHRFEATWQPDDAADDAVAANNQAAAFTVSPGRGSVLIVDGVSGGDPNRAGATLGTTLKLAGIDVQTVGPGAVQPNLLWLQQYDLVILQSVPFDAMPSGSTDAIVSAVTQLGIGLIMVGGPESFGPGGWKGSALEPILPVQLDLPERLITPASALILVIDNSGSMNRTVLGSDLSQQQIANDAAALAIESLDKSDLVGVITFNSSYTVQVPLGPNRDPKATARRVREFNADGGTMLPPALSEAYRQIKTAQADNKHVIVLTDGVSQSADDLPVIVEQMAKEGIRVSTVAIGDGADTAVLSTMASLGGGRAYRVIDPKLLPRVLVRAVRLVRSPQIREIPFVPTILPTGSPVVEGVFLETPPSLQGLVLTQARLDRSVMNVLATPTGEPVLAYWNAGPGRVAAFTSDAHDNWARDWLGWPGYGRLWTQLVRGMSRPPSDRTQTLMTEMVGDELFVRLAATDDVGKPQDGLDIPGTIYSPGGQRVDVRLSQVGPGEYEASVPASESGTYIVTLAPTLAGKLQPPVIGGQSKATGVEFRVLQSNEAALRSIAEQTGGRLLNMDRTGDPGGSADALFLRENLAPALARTSLWRWLGIAAIAIFLLDVATRRIAWDRLLNSERRPLRTSPATTISRTSRPAEQTAGESTELAPLGDEAAEAIRKQEAQRRREARLKAAAAPAPADSASAPAPPTSVEGESGLQAAKRRAQQKMTE